MAVMEEHELISAAITGDDASFELLIRRYTPLVRALLFRQVPNPADVSDIMQEVFLAVYITLPRLRNPRRFSPWIRSITRAKLADFHRHRGALRRTSDFARENTNQRTSHSGLEETEPMDPGLKAEEAELLELVTQSIARLSEKYRMVAYLRIMEEMTGPEIAKRLNLNESTVRTRCNRALARIRQDIVRSGIQAP